MGFKADTSFLEKLKMGATAGRVTIDFLRSRGFEPIELERYSTSNKIWSTKVKRLRLADVLCVRTGLRVEVRGKSDLQIKMSDSPSNPERRWDTGLRDNDLVALVPCEMGRPVRPRGEPVFFGVADMRSSVASAKLGPPKSASEGAERDLTWPSIVPGADGVVTEVTADRIKTDLVTGRRQTYQLKGKIPYVQAGTTFRAGASILAGALARIVDVRSLLARRWDPLADLRAADPKDRYAAAKALPFREDIARDRTIAQLRRVLREEADDRTALEIAGALARLDVAEGFERLERDALRVDESFPFHLRMEAILILSEHVESQRAAEILDSVARHGSCRGTELKQAAVWGLGKAGTRAYRLLVPHLADDEDDVALHAIAAFGPDVPAEVARAVGEALVAEDSSPRARSAASEALRLIGTKQAATLLLEMAGGDPSPWVLATLGRFPRPVITEVAPSETLANAIEPLLLVSEGENWLASREVATDFSFLLQQDMWNA